MIRKRKLRRAQTMSAQGRKKGRAAHRPFRAPSPKEIHYEFELLHGLLPIARKELLWRFPDQVKIIPLQDPSALMVTFQGEASDLLSMRTVVAVFRLLHIKVPHPLEIVRGIHLERVVKVMYEVASNAGISSFRIGAAGSDSPEFRTIKKILAERSGLSFDEAEGEMVIRFRRSRIATFGWDVLIRITPRPLCARPWRSENMPGALNASIAAAMVLESGPKADDVFLNVMCGSGTILVERALLGQYRTLIGVDQNPEALKKARIHVANVSVPAQLLLEDAKLLSLAEESVDAVCVDLPWGRLISVGEGLQQCYLGTLREIGRVIRRAGICVVLTQEWRVFQEALATQQKYWRVVSKFRVKQAEYSPVMCVLRRTSFVAS